MKIWNLKSFFITLISVVMVESVLAGGVLRIDEVPVGELDPAKAGDYADSILMFNVYDALVIPNQGGPGYSPHLAASWEQDGNSYTFKLRRDVKFQSGNQLTADDVVYSLDRMRALGSGNSYLFEGVVESSTVVDNYTVKFNLSSQYSPFVSALTRLPIVDKELVEANVGDYQWGEEFLSANGAGTGAYLVRSHNPQEETVLEKNDQYFLGVANVAPDTVRIRYGLEAPTVRTLISQEEHDISSQWMPPEVLESLYDDGAQLLTEGGTGGFYLKMNTTKPPFDDVNCRLAISNAFDYSTAIKIVAVTDDVSSGSPATGAIPVGMFGANPASQILTRNLTKAKEYLNKCIYTPSEMDIEISWIAEVPLEERIALLLQANISDLGIKSRITKVPWALYTELVSAPETTPHIGQLFYSTITGDPDTLLYGMYHSSSYGTYRSSEFLKDELVDQYLESGRSTDSDREREEIYSKLNDRLMELAATIYVYDRQSIFAASNRVKVPALSETKKKFGYDAIGFSFRLMEMTE